MCVENLRNIESCTIIENVVIDEYHFQMKTDWGSGHNFMNTFELDRDKDFSPVWVGVFLPRYHKYFPRILGIKWN